MKNSNIFKNNKGFTLLEITVAIGLFTIILTLTANIFKYVMESQRSAISSQNIQESMRYAFELMSREIRTATGDHDGSICTSTPRYKVFNTNEAEEVDSGYQLYFKNKNNECVTYATNTTGQLKITRITDEGAGDEFSFPITPDEVDIKKMSFFVIDDEAGAFHSLQPRVTFVIEAEILDPKAKSSRNIKMQTSVSSRYYE